MVNSLNEVFGISDNPPEIIDKSGSVIVPTSNSEIDTIETDYNATRSNLYNLLQSGQDALQHALEVAKQSEHPRAFEVVGNMVKQLADVNQQLLDLTEKKQKLVEPKNREQPNTVTNNAIFVGSTTELNKMLNNMTKGE